MFSLLQDSVRFFRKYCVHTNLVPLNSSSHFPRPYQDKYWLLNTIAWNMKRSRPAGGCQILCCTFRLILILRQHNGIPEVHFGLQVFGAVPRLSAPPCHHPCGKDLWSSCTLLINTHYIPNAVSLCSLFCVSIQLRRTLIAFDLYLRGATQAASTLSQSGANLAIAHYAFKDSGERDQVQ